MSERDLPSCHRGEPHIMIASSTVQNRRRAIIILGMHRSGTSLLTRMISLLGADLPKSLMAPDANNVTGYWESSEICDAVDRILFAAGSAWADWRRFSPVWHLAPEASAPVNDLRNIIQLEFTESDFFVLKDPRLCRVVPMLRKLFDELAIEILPVLILRDPSEVVRSLAKRDQMPRQKAGLLWLRYLLDAEHDTRDLRRVIIDYQELVSDWRAAARKIQDHLGLIWPVSIDAVSVEFEAMLRKTPPTNDSPSNTDGWAGTNWYSRTYALLSDEANVQKNTDELDNISHEISQALRPVAGYISALEYQAAAVPDNRRGKWRNDSRIGTHLFLSPALKTDYKTLAHSETTRLRRALIPPFHRAMSELVKRMYVDSAESFEQTKRMVQNFIVCWPYDESHYLTMYPELARAKSEGLIKSGWQHFQDFGYFEGRLPFAPVVDEAWYLKTSPDVQKAISDGILDNADHHFFEHGYAAGRLPYQPKTDPEWYLRRYFPEGSTAAEADEDYLNRGYLLGFFPRPPLP
jgi:hypothetical protein